MPRLVFRDLAATPPELVAALPKPRVAPPGFTRTSLVVEWLTLNCRGDWASCPRKADVLVRFTDPADRDRALAWARAPAVPAPRARAPGPRGRRREREETRPSGAGAG